jgi:hypothetical protein
MLRLGMLLAAIRATDGFAFSPATTHHPVAARPTSNRGLPPDVAHHADGRPLMTAAFPSSSRFEVRARGGMRYALLSTTIASLPPLHSSYGLRRSA